MKKIPIIFEDKDYLVFNKPYGMVVNRCDSAGGDTIQDYLIGLFGQEYYEKSAHKLFIARNGICHRLDKETSGCLIVAKNAEAMEAMLAQFKMRNIEKEYLALVHGRVEPSEGKVILPLRRNIREREKWQVHFEGKRAVTSWKVLGGAYYDGTEHFKNWVSLISVGLETGRTHQIRVHFSFLGWPLFADEKYLNSDVAKKDRALINHHFLHAKKIVFKTMGEDKVTVVAPLPEENQRLLSALDLD